MPAAIDRLTGTNNATVAVLDMKLVIMMDSAKTTTSSINGEEF
ncbi:Uncharacterised protein [Klebsiella pneumoniae]|nr:Uncharacterised protein [Klebsiella pneumoniae]